MVKTKQASTLIQAMRGSLRGYWAQAEGYQKFLYFVGFLLLASAVFHGVVLVVAGGSLEGDVSWRKPILFGESFGLTAIFVAWVMTFLPKWRVPGWLLSIALGVANLYEVVWVSFQQWRGVPSHFNSNTHFDQALFGLAGVAIGVTGTVILVVTILAFFRLQASPSLAWAIRAGMVLLVNGQVFGALMIAHGGNSLGAAGAMKIPHALALHAFQVLPVLAWLLSFTSWSEGRRTWTVLLAAFGYTVVLVVSATQTFRGLAPSDLSPLAALLGGLGAIFFVGAYATALFRLRASS